MDRKIVGRTFQTFNLGQALVEAQRCLRCYDAPCAKACPVHIDISGFINRFREENLEGASYLIYQACPLGATCGTACPTADLCEGACVLPLLGQNPIRIGSLQSYITLHSKQVENFGLNNSSRKVAVIGGGPSGLGCAIQLRRYGHGVDLYEQSLSLGGMIDKVIPAHRLPHDVIEFDLQRLDHSGINFVLSKRIEPQDIKDMIAKYDAIFIGIGLGHSKSISIPGMESDGVHYALDYLKKARISMLNKGKLPLLGKIVVIIGGGNVALDAAVVSKILGADRVIVLYRRSKEEMPGWTSEYVEAAAFGVEFRWFSIIKEIISINGRVSAVLVQGTKFDNPQKKGRRNILLDSHQQLYELSCDTVIMSVGQSIEKSVPEAFGLSISDNETIDKESLLLGGKHKIFSAGEAVIGGTTIVNSLSQGMITGMSIHQWLERVQEK